MSAKVYNVGDNYSYTVAASTSITALVTSKANVNGNLTVTNNSATANAWTVLNDLNSEALDIINSTGAYENIQFANIELLENAQKKSKALIANGVDNVTFAEAIVIIDELDPLIESYRDALATSGQQ